MPQSNNFLCVRGDGGKKCRCGWFEQIYEMIVTSVHKNQINFELKLLEIIHKEK